jgi:hypothetical protein
MKKLAIANTQLVQIKNDAPNKIDEDENINETV